MTDDYRISVRCHECGRVEEYPIDPSAPVIRACKCGLANMTGTLLHGHERTRALDGQIPFQGLGDLPDGVGVQE
jgi:hypothetical protein